MVFVFEIFCLIIGDYCYMYSDSSRNYYNENIDSCSSWITPSLTNKTLPFYVFESGHFFANKDYRVSRDSHPSFLLLYCINGQGIVETLGQKLVLNRHEAVLINCHSPHSYYSNNCPWEFCWIHINGAGIHGLYENLYSQYPFPIKISRYQSLEQSISDLNEMLNEPNSQNLIQSSFLLYTLLNYLFLEVYNPVQGKNPRDELIDNACSFIETHYFEQITVDSIIEKYPISKYYFIRIFKQKMGVTPYAYLTSYRINKAKQLLIESDLSIDEISYRCGFLDTGSLIKHFKANTGHTPLQYRKWMI